MKGIIRKVAKWSGVEEEIKKEERLQIATEVGEARSWLFGSSGDSIREKNPNLALALNYISTNLVFSVHIDPHNFRSRLLEDMEIMAKKEVESE